MSICPHCLSSLDDAPGGKPRSLQQLRRYFGMLRAVFAQWPETHEQQFSDVTEMRKWLQMKAGHREIGARIELKGMSKERAMLIAEATIRGAGTFAVPVIHGTVLAVFRPKSIKFNKLGHAAFCDLNNEVDDVIFAETGLIAEQCLREHKAIV